LMDIYIFFVYISQWLKCNSLQQLENNPGSQTHIPFMAKNTPKSVTKARSRKKPNLVTFFALCPTESSDILRSKMSRSKLKTCHFEHSSEISILVPLCSPSSGCPKRRLFYWYIPTDLSTIFEEKTCEVILSAVALTCCHGKNKTDNLRA
jgi:hypothetical protein